MRIKKGCDDALARIIELCGQTYYERTRSGGYHIAIRLEEEKTFTNFKLLGDKNHVGEFLGIGRFCVLAPTPGYKSLNGLEIAVAKSAEAIGLEKSGKSEDSSSRRSRLHDRKERESKESESKKSEPKGVSLLQRAFTQQWAGEYIPLEQLVSKKVKSLLEGSGSKVDDKSKLITQVARECYGWDNLLQNYGIQTNGSHVVIREFAKGLVGSEKLERILDSIQASECIPGICYSTSEPLEAAERLIKRALKGREAKKHSEPCSELKKIQGIRKFYEGRLRFNLLSQEIELDGGFIGKIEQQKIEYVEATNRAVGVDLICATIEKIADENEYSPVVDYLDSVANEHTDTGILDALASRLLHTSEPVHQTFLKKWLVGCVARAYNPGVKFEEVLVLQGAQGTYKSTFFNVLAGDGWFSDGLMSSGKEKDMLMHLHSYWIHELGEIDSAFSRKSQGELKNFISRKEDAYRLPYGRQVIKQKRRSAFCATVNPREFLLDETGDRRYWVIPITENVDIDATKKLRDEIWGAAANLYKQGFRHHLSSQEEIDANRVKENF